MSQLFYQLAGAADPFRTGTIMRISAGGVRSYHKPTSDDDAARGDALQAAKTAAQPGDQIHLVPGRTYSISTPASFSTSNLRFNGHDATVKQLAAQDYCLSFNAATAGTEQLVENLNLNVNGTAVPVTSERGEGMRLFGDGRVHVKGCNVYDAPVSASGSCIFTYGTGKKIIQDTTAENPGWACIHIRAYDCDLINCQSRVSAAKAGATKQRFVDMDAANFGHVRVLGCSWWTNQAINAQAVFDPGGSFRASQVTIDDLDIDCGSALTNQVNPLALEGIIKPDCINQFVCKNVRQTHGGNSYQYFLWIGPDCDHVTVSDVHAGGVVHAGDSGSINIEECFIDRSSFGIGQTDAVKFAMDNVRAYRYLQITNSKWYNLIGAGTQAAGLRGAFNSINATSDNFVRMKDCHFDSNWSETAYLFRTIPTIGYLGIDDITVNNRGSGLVAAPTPAQRLMIGSYADAFTARMAWRAIRNSTNLAPLSLTTWDHGHPQPSDTTAWASLVGPPGSRIRNVDPEGNSLQAYFNRDGSGDYV